MSRLAPPPPPRVRWLTAGNWAGLALENARLHQNARRLAALEERNRIGMDLYDGIIQSEYGVGLTPENATHIVEGDPAAAKAWAPHAIKCLKQAVRDMRAYIHDLRPRQLGDEGLFAGLMRFATEYRANTFSEVELAGSETGLEQLSQTRALVLFHFCQQSLGNAAKHARARHVIVRLWMTDERSLIEIQDDVKGFPVETMGSSIGHGLSNMNKRAHPVGGEVEITSIRREGTTVIAWIPPSARAFELRNQETLSFMH